MIIAVIIIIDIPLAYLLIIENTFEAVGVHVHSSYNYFFAPSRLGKLGGGIAQTCLIVIDGLCEAEVHRPDHGNTIASFLAKHLAKFPEWLKVKYFLAF